jgi:hypothetical protein
MRTQRDPLEQVSSDATDADALRAAVMPSSLCAAHAALAARNPVMRLLSLTLSPISFAGTAGACRQQPGGRLRAEEDGEGAVLIMLLSIGRGASCHMLVQQRIEQFMTG